MLDPLLSLAHSITTNKGVYAFLVGSGVSRAASIPTGWEVVLDLISQLANLEEGRSPSDLEDWYIGKYGKKPDYSEILESLAKTPAERQHLLSRYFEPNDSEREAGLKSPTKAHQALASLVVNGYVKVIVTTNFDRLIERAIEEAGVTPVVLSTADSVCGAKPLVHQQCVVIKVHGDYLDTRIKNSNEELSSYAPSVDALLDRILDEYGLVVCGWSGEWDDALRAVFERARCRRYPMYWAARGSPSHKAKKLIGQRDGTKIEIKDADTFLAKLEEKVMGLAEYSHHNPLSVLAAEAATKRYLGDPGNHIQLIDLLNSSTEAAYTSLQSAFEARVFNSDPPKAIESFREICAIVASVCKNMAYFSDRHDKLLCSTLVRLTNDPMDGMSGTKFDFSFRAIPAVFLLYVVGVAATAADNIRLAISVLKATVIRKYDSDQPLIVALDWGRLNCYFQALDPKRHKSFPTSEWMFNASKNELAKILTDPANFERQFNRFEVLLSLVFLQYQRERNSGMRAWAPLGDFAHQFRRKQTFLQDIANDQYITDGLLDSGLFSSTDDIVAARDSLIKLVDKNPFW